MQALPVLARPPLLTQKGRTSRDAATSPQPESSQPESSQPESSRPESSRPESSQPEFSQPESSQPAAADGAAARSREDVAPRVLLPEGLKPLARNFLIAESILNYGHPQVLANSPRPLNNIQNTPSPHTSKPIGERCSAHRSTPTPPGAPAQSIHQIVAAFGEPIPPFASASPPPLCI
eukprot:scaffold28844_cov153-Isochrysis_galbana.AAC.1